MKEGAIGLLILLVVCFAGGFLLGYYSYSHNRDMFEKDHVILITEMNKLKKDLKRDVKDFDNATDKQEETGVVGAVQ